MLDIKLLRENPELVRDNLKKRRDPRYLQLLDELVEHDTLWRQSLTRLNEFRHEKNVLTPEIARLKKEKKEAEARIQFVRALSEKIEGLEREVAAYAGQTRDALLTLPNLLHESVPFGEDDRDNVVVKVVGEPPAFEFEAKNHLAIGLDLDMIDTERGAKTAGHGFVYLKGGLARLDYALLTYTMDFLMERGYLLIEPPYMMRRKPYLGVTDLDFFGDQLYKIEDEDLYLIATSEHPMAAFYMDEVINQSELPIKFVGVSTNFRKEVGAHGKYTRGLFRTHQFNKVEQFIFCLPEDSWTFHEELEDNSEALYRSLGLCFRVVNVCTGDIGSIAAKKYDIEVWMADGEYREAGSNSNCTDYQARRLNVRYRVKEGQTPAGFVHTINNTAIATSRTLVAILEQYQQKDGSVLIPLALQPYMGGLTRLA
ncbi:MAG: serine--tRNA ligase [Candidatus Bathyarchaeota archaeon]|nr:serine--tRNA ligase [Candidatus Bathyarchaeota archaeon]